MILRTPEADEIALTPTSTSGLGEEWQRKRGCHSTEGRNLS